MIVTEHERSALSNIIIQHIQQKGPISFHDFMEMALYHPAHGYYTSQEEKIGKEGDFYTSSSVSETFGALIAVQIEEMWKIMGEKAFTIVEYGAGTGALCRDILNRLKQNAKLYASLRYCIIEKSPAMRAKEQAHLTEKVQWFNCISEIGAIHGCVVSNELLDNLAVHQVVMQQELMEVFVDEYQGMFTETLVPASGVLKNYFEELKVSLPKGYRTEINLNAISWIREVANHLTEGYVLTIDYGYPSAELYKDYRSSGTLVCYYKHRINDNPYIHVGKQDITTHVNFSALCLWGYKHGLEYSGFTDQHHFLMSLGFRQYLKQTAEPGKEYEQFIKEQFLVRTLLIEMGEKFKVLIQHKGVPKHPLAGLKHTPAY